MDLKIDHSCPQCGGGVILEETDRVLKCPYCRVRLYMTSKGPFRYCLNLKEPVKDLIYLPYWRFKGTMYSAVPFKINPQILDASILAVNLLFAPNSLGLRTQTQRLVFATKEVEGRFISPRVPFSSALSVIEAQVGSIKAEPGDGPAVEKAYIGDTTSIIYAPYFIQGNSLYDAILKQAVGTIPHDVDLSEPSRFAEQDWAPGFTSAMCPHCGWDLKGESDDSSFVCRNCNAGWQPRGDEFKKFAVGSIVGGKDAQMHLPFWRIVVEVEGLDLASYADVIRVANLPRAVKPEWESEPFAFWVPAFKVHPHLFLRIARQVTCTPFPGEIAEVVPKGETHPVNLPLSEAIQSLKIVLASFGKPKKSIFQKIPGIRIKPVKGGLVHAPCARQGAELLPEGLGFSISKQALMYGRNL